MGVFRWWYREKEETAIGAVIRETYEELGLNIDSSELEFIGSFQEKFKSYIIKSVFNQ